MPPDPRISEDLRDLFISKYYTKPSQETLEALFQESQNRYIYFFSNFTFSYGWIDIDNPKNAFRNYPEVFSGGNKQKNLENNWKGFCLGEKKENWIWLICLFYICCRALKKLESRN